MTFFSTKKMSRCSSLVDWNCLEISIFSDFVTLSKWEMVENVTEVIIDIAGGKSKCSIKRIEK